MSLLQGPEPFQKFGVGGGGCQNAFKRSALAQNLDLDLKLDQAEQLQLSEIEKKRFFFV